MDCQDDLGCYDPGTQGRGVCSAECTDNPEVCESIAGASWTCSNSTGLCHVECSGEQDDESCPDGLVCIQTSGGGPGSGSDAFRCKHPDDSGPGTQGPYGPCNDSDECADLLICHVPGGFDTGYCTLRCDPEEPNPCEHISAPGSLTPSCEMPYPPTGNSHCALDCEEDPDACPGDMVCVEYSMFSRCGYVN
jgi:hypothetical protein